MIKGSYLRWLIASAAIALMPILARWIYLRIHNEQSSLDVILGGGELFLIAAILSAELVGHMVVGGFWEKEKENIAVVVSALILLLVVPMAIVCYALLCPALGTVGSGGLNMNFVVGLSIILFVATIVGNSVVRTQVDI